MNNSRSPSRRLRSRGASSLRDDVEDREPWLISYADMMTLLVGLFAMMFSFASFDEASARRMDEALTSSFGQPADPAARKAKLTELAESIRSGMSMTRYFEDVNIKESEEGLEVSFGTTSLFSSGSAELTPSASDAMLSLAERIRSRAPGAQIKVEGHTDDVPVRGGRYESNWLLSSARAATIVTLFESVHLPPERLEASGFGSSRPAFQNRDPTGNAIPENQAKNRRVVVKIRLER